MKLLVTICRVFVGVLFIISGLIKANDPLGFSYKLTEYFTVFGTPWAIPFSLVLAIFICVFEVVLGVLTLTGTKPRFTTWSLLGMIIFFTFLTFYSAYYNKVTDCGCFGDAIKLTPWQSFTKDVVLLIFITPIFLYRNNIQSVFGQKGDWITILLSTACTLWFTLYCYNHLPVKDFRPYAIGKNIKEGMAIPDGAPKDEFKITFTYKNKSTGELINLLTDELTKKDSVWFATHEYVDRKEEKIKEGYKPPIHDFAIRSLDGTTDITEDVLNNPKPVFLLVAYDITKTNPKPYKQINQLAQECLKAGTEFIGLTASAYEVVEPFRHEHQLMFDFYNVDETQLKTMIRANPGLILIKNGTVIDMWHYNDLPSFKELSEKYLK